MSETEAHTEVKPQSCEVPFCEADIPEPEPKPLTVQEIIRQEAEQAGIPADVMVDIARAESNFKPHAKNNHSTATGVFQILIGTWNWFECEGERTNARDNIKCAMVIAHDGLHHWNASAHNWR